jgi:hypothetical protein
MKISINRKWVEMHTFTEFTKISYVSKLPYKEQVLLWEHNGGKKVTKKKNKEGEE